MSLIGLVFRDTIVYVVFEISSLKKVGSSWKIPKINSTQPHAHPKITKPWRVRVVARVLGLMMNRLIWVHNHAFVGSLDSYSSFKFEIWGNGNGVSYVILVGMIHDLSAICLLFFWVAKLVCLVSMACQNDCLKNPQKMSSIRSDAFHSKSLEFFLSLSYI